MNVDHHVLALLSITHANIELLATLPDTDIIKELREINEDQFDILQCIIHNRHYGSDDLDNIIQDCQTVISQAKELEGL